MARIRKRRTKKTKAPCEVCSTKKISSKSRLYLLKRGNTHLRQYLPVGNELKQNPRANEKVLLEGLRPRTTFCFFAINSNNKDFTQPIKHFKDAYDTLQNSGVARTDSNGRAEVRVNCPQIYIAEDGNVYSRHFHLIYWNAKAKIWDSRIYTQQIFCNVNKAFVKSMLGKVIILDALTPEYYSQNHIPGAINMPASQNWTLDEVMGILPKGTNSTTPMIIYCYSPECTAAEKLWEKLNRLGFYNTMHYLGGISDWLN
jgi:rhodanese-related sulfurtransferase